MLIHFKKHVEILVVKMKIFFFVLRQNGLLICIGLNERLPNPFLAKIIPKRYPFFKVELNSSQMTYRSKGNTRAALSCIFHHIVSKKINSDDLYADLSDGGNDVPTDSPFTNFSFSSNSNRAILIEDHHFTSSKGYLKLRQVILANEIPWSQRKNTVTWRGSITGDGLIYDEPFSFENRKILPRARLCLMLINQPDTDVAISKNKILQQQPVAFQKLTESGVAKEPIPEEEWLHFKFAIDIDGHTNAWQNFFCRMLMGCCVIKVRSPKNYQQWYYSRLNPWEHFVPVKDDFSDLIEKIEWCQSHLMECEQIANNGKRLAFQIAEESFPIGASK
jgi:hypothetical protein